MDQLTLAYLAGVMDSDGYFTIRRSTYNVRITKDSRNPAYYERVGIKQVTPYAPELIHKNFGGCLRIEKANTKNGKPLYSLQITNLKAHKFIKSIYPYLHIKKQQASILFQLRESLQRGKTLKHKGLQLNRWGQKVNFTRYSVLDEEIALREYLIKEIKKLNDSRTHPKFQPLPWK